MTTAEQQFTPVCPMEQAGTTPSEVEVTIAPWQSEESISVPDQEVAYVPAEQPQGRLSRLGAKISSLASAAYELLPEKPRQKVSAYKLAAHEFISEKYEKFANTKTGKVARGIGKLGMVAATSAAYIFEIGPWNEVFRVEKAVEILQRTESAIAVGLGTAALTAAIEIVPSGLVASGLNYDKGLMKKLNSKLEKRSLRLENARIEKQLAKQQKREAKLEKRAAETNPSLLKKSGYKVSDAMHVAGKPLKRAFKGLADYGLSMGGGAAMLVATRHFRRGGGKSGFEGFKADFKDAIEGTGYIAATCGAIGWFVTGGINYVTNLQVETLTGMANFVARHGANTTSWRILMGIYYGALGAGAVMSNREKIAATAKNLPGQIAALPEKTIDLAVDMPNKIKALPSLIKSIPSRLREEADAAPVKA